MCNRYIVIWENYKDPENSYSQVHSLDTVRAAVIDLLQIGVDRDAIDVYELGSRIPFTIKQELLLHLN